MDAPSSLRDGLIGHGLLIPMGVDGLYAFGEAFEVVIDGLTRWITRHGAHEGAEVFRFPPAFSQTRLEESGYLKAFPHFAGTIHCFCGDERAHRALLQSVEEHGDWTGGQRASGLALTPAACYPAYSLISARGMLPPDGVTADVQATCFRHEPSLEPTRMQSFRMREFVRIGAPGEVVAFRTRWLEKSQAMVGTLGLQCTVDIATDPFFGRVGSLMADNQRAQRLKFELLVQVLDGAPPTACLSFNYHMDNFGVIWNLRTAAGEVAHTACVGFGMERLAIALFRHYGFDSARWPVAVRQELGLT
jgi:seryl-tRNA synthetase